MDRSLMNTRVAFKSKDGTSLAFSTSLSVRELADLIKKTPDGEMIEFTGSMETIKFGNDEVVDIIELVRMDKTWISYCVIGRVPLIKMVDDGARKELKLH